MKSQEYRRVHVPAEELHEAELQEFGGAPNSIDRLLEELEVLRKKPLLEDQVLYNLASDFSDRLASVDGVPSDNEGLLSQFDQALKQSLAEVVGEKGVELMAESGASRVEAQLFVTIVEKIEAVCGSMELFRVLERTLPLVTPEAVERLIQDNLIAAKEIGATGEAVYNKRTGTIGIDFTDLHSEVFKNQKNLLHPLMLLVDFFEQCETPTATLKHEYTHVLQSRHEPFVEESKFTPDNAATGLIEAMILEQLQYLKACYKVFLKKQPESIIDHKARTESHAFVAEWRSLTRNVPISRVLDQLAGNPYYRIKAEPTEADKSTKDSQEIAQETAEARRHADRVIMAVYQIKQLYALGYTEEKIAELVVKARWNAKKSCFDELDKGVASSLKKKGLTNDDLENLVIEDDLKRKIFIYKAQLIIQEEITKAANQVSTSA